VQQLNMHYYIALHLQKDSHNLM